MPSALDTLRAERDGDCPPDCAACAALDALDALVQAVEQIAPAAQTWADGKSIMFTTDLALVDAINEALTAAARVKGDAA